MDAYRETDVLRVRRRMPGSIDACMYKFAYILVRSPRIRAGTQARNQGTLALVRVTSVVTGVISLFLPFNYYNKSMPY